MRLENLVTQCGSCEVASGAIRFLLGCFFGLTAATLAACASIVGETDQAIVLNTSPSEAQLSITDENGKKVYEGVTPTTVTLAKSDGYFDGQTYEVTFSKEGFDDRVVTITSQPNAWYIGGNIVFGGLIGWLIVDPATGAMWALDPEEVDVELSQKLAERQEINPALHFAALDDVPLTMRQHMIPVS